VTIRVDADYLVVGAGATGMAFTDSLIAHSDARVAIVDRRADAGGHWRDAYSFVRLHQASSFYGVASMPLGGGRLQLDGPEAGLHERATGDEICAYYDGVRERLSASGQVEFFFACDYVGDGRFARPAGRQHYAVAENCRIVDARYLAPTIPADTPPPFDASDEAAVVPVGKLPRVAESASHFVIVGSGKTATDAVVWLLKQGFDSDTLTWVRPREPWMLNRSRVQPEPAIFRRLGADVLSAAVGADSFDDVFLRLEEAGVMLRIDPTVTPTMAKAPTLGTWELDLLRSVENVVRLGHVTGVSGTRMTFEAGGMLLSPGSAIVHCAADGLPRAPLVPIWGVDTITLQPIRAGFPCFGAALAGYIEATRDDDVTKNALGPPNRYGNTLSEWAEMTVRGSRATASFLAEPDIGEWADSVALNPARTAVADDGVAEQLLRDAPAGLSRLAELAGVRGA